MPNFIQRFRRDKRASVALTFALAAMPMSMMVGMGVDIANATRVRLALQDATDSAAIGLAREQASIADNQISSTAKTYIQQSYNKTLDVTITNATIDRSNIVATVDSRVDVPTFFSELVGVSSIPVTAHSVSKGLLLEIGLVLDTSGSMSQTAGTGGVKITALKAAVTTLLNDMFGAQTTSTRVSLGIIPFATNVNVGSTHANDSWMDTAGTSSIAEEDFVSNAETRWQLFSDMKSQTWKGCIMTRNSALGYDVNDTAPSSSTPDTLFDPWFAPDEPDGDNGALATGTFNNNYLDDEGGGCTGTNTNKAVADSVKQARICKYKGVKPVSGLGPNYMCDSQPITPLTNVRTGLDTAVTNLAAAGNTNILEGLMWGWRVLSPGEPFTEGKPYNAPNNKKVIILMTDGVNNMPGASNFDHSVYNSYGYSVYGRVGTTSNKSATLISALDAKTATACANAKAQGIMIYTIGFGSGATASTALLKGCATDPKYFYAPQNSSDLVPVFQAIADSINSLRLAE